MKPVVQAQSLGALRATDIASCQGKPGLETSPADRSVPNSELGHRFHRSQTKDSWLKSPQRNGSHLICALTVSVDKSYGNPLQRATDAGVWTSAELKQTWSMCTLPRSAVPGQLGTWGAVYAGEQHLNHKVRL